MKDTLFYKIVRPILWLLFRGLFRPVIVGKNNIPKNGGIVLAGNHTKWLDAIMLITACPRQVHFLAKDSLFKGFMGILLRGVGGIPVNRKIHDKDALLSAKKTLSMDLCIGIFPEGTINRTDDIIMPFKIGAVKMCNVTGAKLVPFVITGEYKLFGKGITIEFLKAREVSDDLDLENKKLMELVSSKLKKRGKKDGKK